MAETKKVRMKVSRGNPSKGGAIFAASAVVEVPSFWADKWIAEGVAEEVRSEPETSSKEKKNGRKGKS